MSKDVMEALGEAIEGLDSFKHEVKGALNESGTRLDRIEAKMDRAQLDAPQRRAGVAARVMQSPELKALTDGTRQLASGERRRFEVVVPDVKALVGVGAAPDSVVPVAADRSGQIVGQPFRRLRVLDLLPVLPASSGSAEFPRQTGFTEGAGYQDTEGARKGESSPQIELMNVPIATIAHWVKASTQVLADLPQLQSYVERLMEHYLRVKLEREVLSGDGIGRHIPGFLTEAPVFVPTATATPDRISEQLAAIEVADYEPDAVVMHPNLWHSIRTSKAAGSGEYLAGNFSNPAQASLWGVPVIRTRSIPANKVLTGAFAQGAALLMRQAVGVEIGRDADDFTKNLLTILAEVRAGLAIFDLAAFNQLTLA